MGSAQGVYPICADDNTAVAFKDFVHTMGAAIFRAAGGAWVPQVDVSLVEGARSQMAKTVSAVGVFRQDN
jgi:hypothetical protein